MQPDRRFWKRIRIARPVCRRASFLNKFDDGIFAYDVKRKKTDRLIHLLLPEILSHAPEDCISSIRLTSKYSTENPELLL